MAIDFPNSPSNNDTFNVGSVVWIYSGGKWILQATAPSPLPVSITSVASGQFLKWNGTAWVNDAIDLGTDTTGSYVTSLVAGTGVTLTNNSGEGATPTIAVDTAVIQERVSNVTDIEIGYLDGVTSAIQTQLTAKAPTASPVFTGTVAGITATMVGLGSVDNTADTAKPVSTAQQTALNLKANLAGPTFTGTVSGITATMVGLGSVDNTADTAKPVSTAQQTALDLKANLASPTLTGTPTAPTAAALTNTTQVATTAFVRAEVAALVGSAGATLDTLGELAAALGSDASFSTTVTTSIGLKAPIASPALTGTPTAPTAAALTNTTQIATTAFVATAVASAAIATLDDIGNVTAPTPSSGQFLKWNGTAWVPDTVPTINALDDIGNVTAPSPTIGEVLTWNGTAWVDSDAVRDNMIKFYMEVI